MIGRLFAEMEREDARIFWKCVAIFEAVILVLIAAHSAGWIVRLP